MPDLAALAAAGWDGIAVRCRGCRYTVTMFFGSPRLPLRGSLAAVAGRLRCRRCGTRPEPADVRAWFYERPQCAPPGPVETAPSAADP